MNSKLKEVTQSLWIIPSIIVFINGIGLMYAGLRVHKRQWFIEGIIYEIPYLLFQFIYNDVYTNDAMNMTLRMFCFLAISLSLIRSVMIRKTFIELLNNINHIDEDNLPVNIESKLSDTHPDTGNYSINKMDSKDKVDINTATLEELLTVPGFNTIIAKQLIQYRNTGNYIHSEDDLANKLSLSKTQVERISQFIDIKVPKVDNYSDNFSKLDL